MPRFTDDLVRVADRYSLGVDGESGQYFLSIPVANRLVDYEEYYAITPSERALFEADEASARVFADECRDRRHDDRLILPPGSDRGAAI